MEVKFEMQNHHFHVFIFVRHICIFNWHSQMLLTVNLKNEIFTQEFKNLNKSFITAGIVLET